LEDRRPHDAAPQEAAATRSAATSPASPAVPAQIRRREPGTRLAVRRREEASRGKMVERAARGRGEAMEADEERTRIKAPPGQDQLPFSDGEPMETMRHFEQMMLLVTTLGEAWRERDDFFVGGNQFIYFSELQTRRNDFRGPDVYVVLDTEKKERKSWVVWEENGRLPNVVIELLSESTERVDRGEKMRIYARVWRTPEYYLYDPIDHRFEGYVLDPVRGEYQRLEHDAEGALPVRQLGLRLAVRDTKLVYDVVPALRWIDDSGAVLPTDHERLAAQRASLDAERVRAESERERAESERERAEAAERRLAELEAELRRPR
jgi:Uma2 family endonuclease